jgi:hypothetical protein
MMPADLDSCAKYKQFRAAAFTHMLPHLQEKLHSMSALFASACSEMKEDFESHQKSVVEACSKESTQNVGKSETEAIKSNLVSVTVSDDSVSLFLNESVASPTVGRTDYKIRKAMYDKLKTRFCASSNMRSAGFNVSLWCLLHRYQALMGPSGVPRPSPAVFTRLLTLFKVEPHVITMIQHVESSHVRAGEGSNWHLATPTKAMEQLVEQFGVSCECFASPLNATCGSFCSAFICTDACLGSRGGFFSQSFTSGGSFEVGPPYNITVVSMVAEKILQELQETEDHGVLLSFSLEFWGDEKSSCTFMSICCAFRDTPCICLCASQLAGPHRYSDAES